MHKKFEKSREKTDKIWPKRTITVGLYCSEGDKPRRNKAGQV